MVIPLDASLFPKPVLVCDEEISAFKPVIAWWLLYGTGRNTTLCVR
ncbi:hypothetical protein THZG08_60066 [Vibrio owensii]|nr:hypothetical protein THZG08_60066 [Vibrio owensii]